MARVKAFRLINAYNMYRNIFLRPASSYYDFMAESSLGLYTLLDSVGGLDERACRIWYAGTHGEIVQLFSKFPVQVARDLREAPADAFNVQPHRPGTLEEWSEMRSLSVFLSSKVPKESGDQSSVVTLIKTRR